MYFGEYVNPFIFQLCTSAENKSKFNEIKDEIFRDYNHLVKDQEVYNLFVKKNKLNDRNKDLQQIRKSIFDNKTRLNNVIYATPTFIVNNIIYDQKNAIEFLETLIK